MLYNKLNETAWPVRQMARTFDQIYKSLGSAYDPSVALVQQQIDAIPQATQTAIEQANAQKDQAFTDITNQARQRGMGFSGIPLSEQASYLSTNFAPAIANLKSSAESNKNSLLQSIQQYVRDRNNQAQSIFDNEENRALQQKQLAENTRQFNENLAYQKAKDAADRAASSQASTLSYLNTGSGSTPVNSAKISRTSSGGFNFFDATGAPINAAQYAQLTGVGYRDLLAQMAKAGDKNAKLALNYVGNDAKFGSAPQSAAGALSALGAKGTYAPAQTYTTQTINGTKVKVPNF